MIPISVVILTKNEELAIADCIESVVDFDQIIVIDSNSSDRTCAIASNLGAQIINFEWNNRYPKKKQWGLELKEIRNDWVIYLDADERPTKELVKEIRKYFDGIREINYSAFEIPLTYQFLGKNLKHGHKVRKVALINKNFCKFPEINDLGITNMWEVEGHYQPLVEGKMGSLQNAILHSDPDPLYDYFSRHNRYSDWEAELRLNISMQKQVRELRTRQGRFFDYLPWKPLVFFLYSYFWRFGWRDGREGFNYSIALSFYYWQISIKVLERRSIAKVI